MVLFLMVTGNMTTVYQKEFVDASKKCTEVKKIREDTERVRSGSDFWVEMKIDGLKTGVKSGSL